MFVCDCVDKSMSVYQPGANPSRTVISPALGELWSHGISNRVMLQFAHSVRSSELIRHASLVKSPSLPCKTVSYLVSAKGIRDVPVSKNDTQDIDVDIQQKRQRLI
jgi:hypothetical protein